MGLFGSLKAVSAKELTAWEPETYLRRRWVKNMRVVFSSDFMSTLDFGVIGELASLRGLKLRTELRMRLEVFGRVRIKMERQFSEASTRRTSLCQRLVAGDLRVRMFGAAYLLLSCNIPRILSKRPVASASSCLGSNKG